MFVPVTDILPPVQRRLWEELGATPAAFVLYGGTALALRLGHRPSADFDFFANLEFEPGTLAREISYLKGAEVLQSAANTLVCSVERGGEVRLAFFGGLGMNHVAAPDRCPDNGVKVASLLDLAATKVKVIQDRAAWKDYADLDAILQRGIPLEQALAAARAVYGPRFNPLLSLKALAYYEDGSLTSVTPEARKRLMQAALSVDGGHLPEVAPLPGLF